MVLVLRTAEPDSEDQGYIAWLYDISFPPAEQERMENIMKVSRTDFGHLSVVLDGGTRVGMLYILTHRDLVYVYYLAVDPEMRKRGYGSEILSIVKREHPGCRFVLSCEAPDDKPPTAPNASPASRSTTGTDSLTPGAAPRGRTSPTPIFFAGTTSEGSRSGGCSPATTDSASGFADFSIHSGSTFSKC